MYSLEDISIKNVKFDNRYADPFYKGILYIKDDPVAHFEFNEKTKTGIAVFNYYVLKLGNSLNYSLENQKHLQKYLEALQKDSDNEDLFFNIVNEYFKKENFKETNLNYIYDLLIEKYKTETGENNGTACK